MGIVPYEIVTVYHFSSIFCVVCLSFTKVIISFLTFLFLWSSPLLLFLLFLACISTSIRLEPYLIKHFNILWTVSYFDYFQRKHLKNQNLITHIEILLTSDKLCRITKSYKSFRFEIRIEIIQICFVLIE